MKTISEALQDEMFYPFPIGKVENILMRRDLNGNDEVTADILQSHAYKGALADCLRAFVLQGVSLSEAGKSVSMITDAQKKEIYKWINRLYAEIGEEEVVFDIPTVRFI